MRRSLIVLFLLLATATVFFLRKKPPHSPENPQSSVPETSISAPPRTSLQKTFSHTAPIDHSNTDPRFTRFTDGTVYLHQPLTLSQQLHKTGESPEHDLQLLDSLFSSYRTVFKENPVGTDNWEFATALSGDNPKKVVFLDPATLKNKELHDRWDTPYRFHPISSEQLEIRSAGPDKTFWTKDDLIFPETST